MSQSLYVVNDYDIGNSYRFITILIIIMIRRESPTQCTLPVAHISLFVLNSSLTAN